MTSRRLALLAFAVAAGLVLALQAWRGAAQVLPEPDIARLECLSYAHPGALFEWGAKQPIPPAVIESDLAALARVSGCVRTYSTGDGQDVVVQVAEQLGLKVILGAWLGADADKNRAEIDRAVALANAHPQTIRTIVLGNETLLRREMSAGALIALIQEAKTRTQVPVTTAEIWSFWLRQPELAQAVDLLTVHVLPYWDGDDVHSIGDAVAFSIEAIGKVAAAYAGKPILIGEIGWPSVGRARSAVAPGIVEQARFARGIAALATQRGWTYNLIEGYDQPWKRRGEGTVGGAWGLLHANGTPKAALAGPVSPHPDALLMGVLAVLLGVIGLVTAGRTRWRAALAAPPLALLLVEQAEFSRHAVAHWHEPPLHLLAWMAAAVIACAALRALATGERPAAVTTAGLFCHIASAPGLSRASTSGRSPSKEPEGSARMAGTGPAMLGMLLFALRFGAACLALGQVLDPRYRDFAAILFALPLLAPLVFRRDGRLGPEDTALGALLLVCAAGSLLLSGLANTQAVIWTAALTGLALPLLVTADLGQQTEHDRRPTEAEIAEGQGDPAQAHAEPGQTTPA